MRRRAAALATATAGLFAASAAAQAQDLGNLHSMVFLTGTCERLVIAGREATADCRGVVVNLNYRSGRTSFVFSEGQARMISFSGMGSRAEGDSARHTLDMVSVAQGPDASVESVRVTGSCEYSNPYSGRSYVRCTAFAESGEYSASFLSDGSPPEVRELPAPPGG